jgi:protein phosphatase PTC2/3
MTTGSYSTGSPQRYHIFFLLSLIGTFLGAAVAKYCGQFLHKKVLDEPTFSEKKYENALRDGFLKTDRDLREGKEFALCGQTQTQKKKKNNPPIYSNATSYLDKEFANDSSGCTAVVALITEDNHVLVVSYISVRMCVIDDES